MNTILNRYIAKEFFKAFFFTILIFTLVIQIGHLFDRLEVFMRNQVSWMIIIPYLFAMAPFWLIQALPLCTLIAGVFTIGNMSQAGELFCLNSSGISSRQILKPLLFVGIFLTVVTFFLGDTLMPRATYYARSLYRTYVDKVGLQKNDWYDIIVLAKNHKRISAKHLDLENNRIHIVTVEEYGDHLNLRQALTAQTAEWSPEKGWIFYEGVVRLFSRDGNEIVEEESFVTAQIDLPEKPSDLVPLQAMPEELSLSELKAYIAKIQNLGIPTLKERVQYHLKIAFPFTHILVLGIGLPIAFKTTPVGGGRGKKAFGRMKSLAIALLIAFAYYTFVTMGQALGESRKMPPWAGIWLANSIFLIAGIHLTRKVE